jgi:arginyl-tRNA synthetase
MKDKKIGEFMFAAGTAEMIHRTGVHVHDDFPYIKNKKGEEFVFLDGREFEIQRKISLKKGSKIIFEKQEDYFDKVYKKIAKINKQKKKSKKDKEYLKVIIGQLVMLYRNGEPVRLSKRTGEIITLEEVMEEIGTDAARYFLAMKSADNTLEFDLELAKKKGDENPVFYVQYAHARIASIFRQPEAIQIKAELKIDQISIEERTLLVHLLRFPEEIENICRHYGVQMLAGYAQALAKLFHYFYHHCRVLDINDVPRSQFRLALSQLAQEILAKTLALMGVSAPQKM